MNRITNLLVHISIQMTLSYEIEIHSMDYHNPIINIIVIQILLKTQN